MSYEEHPCDHSVRRVARSVGQSLGPIMSVGLTCHIVWIDTPLEDLSFIIVTLVFFSNLNYREPF